MLRDMIVSTLWEIEDSLTGGLTTEGMWIWRVRRQLHTAILKASGELITEVEPAEEHLLATVMEEQ